ncbi:MAG: hypothetical protein Q9225_005755, partial [Loekoesia sp. 1 TL-2023]
MITLEPVEAADTWIGVQVEIVGKANTKGTTGVFQGLHTASATDHETALMSVAAESMTLRAADLPSDGAVTLAVDLQ